MRVPQGFAKVSMCVLLAAAEGEVAPRDVLEHVREILHDGRAGFAPSRALIRKLVAVGKFSLARRSDARFFGLEAVRVNDRPDASCFWCTRGAWRLLRQELLREQL